jgi:hypothetical protein
MRHKLRHKTAPHHFCGAAKGCCSGSDTDIQHQNKIKKNETNLNIFFLFKILLLIFNTIKIEESE